MWRPIFVQIANSFILWSIEQTKRRYACRSGSTKWCRTPVVTFDRKFLFARFEPLWSDEGIKSNGNHYNRPPWWRPFNVLVHWWNPAVDSESFHDHPRWSITICLRGRIIEKTPWWTRELRPGSIVVRSHKAIHAFEVPHSYRGKTWTLFIVGRRNHRQNAYVITPQGVGTAHAKE